MTARLVRIGNSCGVRIPQKVLEHYRISDGALFDLEERQEGILLRPQVPVSGKVSWSVAYEEMAQEVAEQAEWSDWNGVSGDGLGD